MSLIKEAALNTLLGMGMTFLVLITLSLIISLFGKILNGGFNRVKEDTKTAKNTPQKAAAPVEEPVERAAAVSEPEASAPEEDPALMAVISAAVAAYESSDISPEMVAVIAAAVAASEEKSYSGIPGASGYAVRKIRKSRKHVA